MAYLDEQGNEIEYLTETNEPGYVERVSTRIAGAAPTIATGLIEGLPELIGGGGEGRFKGGLKALGALGALMEPLMAPVGEAARPVGRYAGESFLKTGVLPGAEGFAPEPVDVSKVTPKEAHAVREGAGGAYALGAEAASGFGRPVANIAAKAGLKIPMLSNRVTPTGQKMIDIMGYGAVRPAQVARGRIFDFMDNVAGESIFGAGIYSKHAARRGKVIEDIADDFAGLVGTHIKDPQMRGIMLKSIVDLEDDAWRAAGSKLFKQVDQIHPTPAVDMGPVYDTVRKLQAEFPEGTEAGNLLKTIGAQIKPSVSQTQHPLGNILGPLGTPMMTSTTTTTPAIKTFLESNDLRSWAYAWKTPGLSAGGDQAARVGTIVGGALDEAIELAGKNVSPAARKQLEIAREFWKGESALFNRRAVRRILHDGNLPPEKVVDLFLKPGKLTEIQTLRKMVGGPDSQAWGTVRRSFVEDMLESSRKFDLQSGVPYTDGNVLMTALRTWGDDTVKEVLGATHAGLLGDIAETIAGAQAKVGGGGGMFVQLTQAGALIKALTLGAGAGDVGIVLAPPILAKIFTSEKATKILLEGLRASPGTASAKRYAAMLSNFIQPGRRQSEEPESSELEKMFFGGSAK